MPPDAALLDEHNPGLQEARRAYRGRICRIQGYIVKTLQGHFCASPATAKHEPAANTKDGGLITVEDAGPVGKLGHEQCRLVACCPRHGEAEERGDLPQPPWTSFWLAGLLGGVTRVWRRVRLGCTDLRPALRSAEALVLGVGRQPKGSTKGVTSLRPPLVIDLSSDNIWKPHRESCSAARCGLQDWIAAGLGAGAILDHPVSDGTLLQK
mmetsp:Transcript_8599/g.19582  ORF Transcript_8599/g.19582 Transcript_8599/m.19582 type:complete len:210 (+) Transcript_8599:539-1168(+)